MSADIRTELDGIADQLPRPEHASSSGVAAIRMHKALEAVADVLDQRTEADRYGLAVHYQDQHRGCVDAGDLRKAITEALTP